MSALPRLGEQIRDLERYVAQARDVFDRDVDPDSLPDAPLHVQAVTEARLALGFYLDSAMDALARLAALPLPPVGSAVHIPAAPIQPGASPTRTFTHFASSPCRRPGRSSADWANVTCDLCLTFKLPPRPAASEGCAVPGGAGLNPPLSGLGGEPTPGSAAALSGAARESDGAVVVPVAGADFPPLGNGRPSGLVELSAPRKVFDRSAGSPAQAPGADGDFQCSSCSGTCQSRLDCIGQPVRAADFRLPRDVRDDR